MQRLNLQECEMWMEQRGLGRESGRIQPRYSFHAVDRALPKASRAIAHLADRIASTSSNSNQVLLVICAWGIWPSEEFTSLFTKAMTGYGDSRKLEEAPGFLLSSDERDDLKDLTRLAMISGWDAGILPAGGEVSFFISHDEWYSIFAASVESLHAWGKDNQDELLWSGCIK